MYQYHLHPYHPVFSTIVVIELAVDLHKCVVDCDEIAAVVFCTIRLRVVTISSRSRWSKTEVSWDGAYSVASLGGVVGGAARLGCHYFGVTPFYDVFVMKTFCFNLLGLHLHTQRKPTEFSAKTFFLVFTNVTNRGWHHERCITHTGWHHALPPRVSPSLARPLCISPIASWENLQLNRIRQIGLRLLWIPS